jgi:hypothetical protein
MGRLKSDVLVAETVQGSDWYPAISMSIVKIRSAPVGWDTTQRRLKLLIARYRSGVLRDCKQSVNTVMLNSSLKD